MKTNAKAVNKLKTHEGAPAMQIKPEQALRRSVLACLLWEDSFYENGEDIATRIKTLAHAVPARTLADLAIEARNKYKLRHVPLVLLRELCRHKGKASVNDIRDVFQNVIMRADELAEFLAIYWKDGREKLAACAKKGLAAAFTKFNEYSLAKYNRDNVVKLRDVLFLCHAKPKDEAQAETWKKLVEKKLTPPDTWEVALSAGKDKKETFERLITEGKLGGMAFLRNLRNMQQAGVTMQFIREAMKSIDVSWVLPFRFITAARHAPTLEPELETLMLKNLEGKPKLPGTTVLMVDVSGSMDNPLSSKSDMTRLDAACGLAVMLREVCEYVLVVTFSHQLVAVPSRRGFALRDAIVGSQSHGGTYLGNAIRSLTQSTKDHQDRLIVFTDEQSHDAVQFPKDMKNYVINVASYKNGIGYGGCVHIDGFSEACVDFIVEHEKQNEE